MVHLFGRAIIAPFAKLWLKPVQGLDRLPHPPYIVAANHSSYLDDLFVPCTFIPLTDREMHIFVNSRYYKSFFLRKFLYHYNCIPVDVAKDVPDEERRRKTNDKAFAEAAMGLKKGHLFAVFPEGGRSPDGKLQKAKTGVARVALASQVPVVPVGIAHSYQIMPKGAVFPRFRRAEMRIGAPLTFKRFAGKDDPKTLQAVTRTIMREIAKLAGQSYGWELS